MSHYVAWVLLPEDTKPEDIEAKLEAALAPFSEHLEVEPYSKVCFCVGGKARVAAREAADQAVGTIDAKREKFHKDPRVERENTLMFKRNRTPEEDAELNSLSEESQARWEALLKPWNDAEAAAFAADSRREEAALDCEECNGTGTYQSTYSPKSRWDWYQIGGRWDGGIFEPGQPGKNTRKLSDMPSPIPDSLLPFAILTPDGEWHEKGKMLYFAVVAGEQKDWKDIARAELAKHGDSLAVLVDLHI